MQPVEENHSTSQILPESALFFIQAPSLACVCGLESLNEQEDETPHSPSVNDAIYHMNTGNINIIKSVI